MLSTLSRKVVLFLPPYSGQVLGPPLSLLSLAGSLREAGYEPCLIDGALDRDFPETVVREIPDALCFGGNYLANVPEIVDLAKSVKAALPNCFVFVGGHSASFIAPDLLRHSEGAIDCVLKGEGEASVTVRARSTSTSCCSASSSCAQRG